MKNCIAEIFYLKSLEQTQCSCKKTTNKTPNSELKHVGLSLILWPNRHLVAWALQSTGWLNASSSRWPALQGEHQLTAPTNRPENKQTSHMLIMHFADSLLALFWLLLKTHSCQSVHILYKCSAEREVSKVYSSAWLMDENWWKSIQQLMRPVTKNDVST